jgi:hypothetical protein
LGLDGGTVWWGFGESITGCVDLLRKRGFGGGLGPIGVIDVDVDVDVAIDIEIRASELVCVSVLGLA